MSVLYWLLFIVILSSIFVYIFGSQIVLKLSDSNSTNNQIANIKDLCVLLRTINIVIGVIFSAIIVGSLVLLKGKGFFILVKLGILIGCLSAVNIMMIINIDKVLNSTVSIDVKKSNMLKESDSIQKVGMVAGLIAIFLMLFFIFRK